MNSKNTYSDEQLQSFVDDELSVEDRSEIMEAIRNDDELACHVCELLQIKDTVRLAYREPEYPEHGKTRHKLSIRKTIPLGAAAAVLVFVMGATTGILTHTYLGNPTPDTGGFSGVEQNARQEIRRVVIHISSADEALLDQALSDAEQLLANYRDQPERVQMEIVANTKGLALLRADLSPFPDRIKRLAEQFSNISFLACSRTIEKLHMRGIDVHLLPEAEVIPGALEQIVDRMQQGWVYIRV